MVRKEIQLSLLGEEGAVARGGKKNVSTPI